MKMRDDHVSEEIINGRQAYTVYLDGGNIEISFYKTSGKFAKAWSWYNDTGDEWYNSKELSIFKMDYGREYMIAVEMVRRYIQKHPVKKKAPAKKVVRRISRK